MGVKSGPRTYEREWDGKWVKRREEEGRERCGEWEGSRERKAEGREKREGEWCPHGCPPNRLGASSRPTTWKIKKDILVYLPLTANWASKSGSATNRVLMPIRRLTDA